MELSGSSVLDPFTTANAAGAPSRKRRKFPQTLLSAGAGWLITMRLAAGTGQAKGLFPRQDRSKRRKLQFDRFVKFSIELDLADILAKFRRSHSAGVGTDFGTNDSLDKGSPSENREDRTEWRAKTGIAHPRDQDPIS
jgi:hypothetical protein